MSGTGADEYLARADYANYPKLQRYARARYGRSANGADAYIGFINWMNRLVRSRGRTLRCGTTVSRTVAP